MIEGGFDVIECVVVGDDVGGAVVSVDTGGARARLLSNDVRSSEVRFERVPGAGGGRHAVPFDEGLTVEARELDGHDCPRTHLFHGVGRRGDDGRNIAVFEAVKICLEGFGWIPRGGKSCIVGVAFRG